MKYSDGQQMRVGDKVKVWEGCTGVIVCVLDDDQYSGDFPKAEWNYLKTGVLVDTDKAGLIHYPTDDHSLKLLERASHRS
ncbi:MAG: hypothetical protein E8D40_14860 [Nitrospira sp.]|nr:MAG: hypothetical protein E8D40_14860 [Nitrospira sp.]